SASGDAEALKARIALLGLSARVESGTANGRTDSRVRMGPHGTATALAEAKQKLGNGGLPALAIKAHRAARRRAVAGRAMARPDTGGVRGDTAMAIEAALIKPVVDALLALFRESNDLQLKRSADRALREAIRELLQANPDENRAQARI